LRIFTTLLTALILALVYLSGLKAQTSGNDVFGNSFLDLEINVRLSDAADKRPISFMVDNRDNYYEQYDSQPGENVRIRLPFGSIYEVSFTAMGYTNSWVIINLKDSLNEIELSGINWKKQGLLGNKDNRFVFLKDKESPRILWSQLSFELTKLEGLPSEFFEDMHTAQPFGSMIYCRTKKQFDFSINYNAHNLQKLAEQNRKARILSQHPELLQYFVALTDTLKLKEFLITKQNEELLKERLKLLEEQRLSEGLENEKSLKESELQKALAISLAKQQELDLAKERSLNEEQSRIRSDLMMQLEREHFENQKVADEQRIREQELINKANLKQLEIAEQEKKRRELELSNQKIKQQSLGVVAIFISLIALLFVRGYILKRRTAKDLAQQNEVISKQNQEIEKEKRRSDELLLNILPEKIAVELKEKGTTDAQLIDEATVLFTDFKDFSKLSERLSPKDLVAEINECFSAFDLIMQQYGVEKIKTIGDAYMAAGGIPLPNKSHAEDVVSAALAIQDFMKKHKEEKQAAGAFYFEIRIGVHTGPLVAGIVGVKKFAYDIWGDTVNTASRMESSGETGKVNISGSTYELVKSRFHCSYRGKIEAKGKGAIDMYFVEGRL
jgi:class 3 adenylate cyclase